MHLAPTSALLPFCISHIKPLSLAWATAAVLSLGADVASGQLTVHTTTSVLLLKDKSDHATHPLSQIPQWF